MEALYLDCAGHRLQLMRVTLGRSAGVLMAFPTSEECISKTEARLGVRLPESLRAHLLAENGGEVEVDNDSWSLFPVADSSDRKRLARSANHIVAEGANARMWSGFPQAAVAIAENGAGDFLILLPYFILRTRGQSVQRFEAAKAGALIGLVGAWTYNLVNSALTKRTLNT